MRFQTIPVRACFLVALFAAAVSSAFAAEDKAPAAPATPATKSAKDAAPAAAPKEPAKEAAAPVEAGPAEGYCVIPIRGTIGLHVTDGMVEKALDAARKANAHTIIFDIDSPGGLAPEMSKITKRIVDWQSSKKAVALVNPAAHSAAAIIAVACKDIFMAPASTIGATAELNGPKDGMIRIKHDSVTRAADRALAQFGGHDPVILEGMFDPNIEIWMTPPGKDDKTGKYTFQSTAGDRFNTRNTAITGASRIKAYGQILTLSASDAVKYGFATAEAKEYSEIGLRLAAKNWEEVGHNARKIADAQVATGERFNKEVEALVDKVGQINTRLIAGGTLPLMRRRLAELRSAKTAVNRLEQIVQGQEYFRATVDMKALDRVAGQIENAISSTESRIQSQSK